MRELRFRAWHKKRKKMYYFPLEGLWEGGFYLGIDEEDRDAPGFYVNGEDIEIMQYTGLKDKNGKEIYEGDICIQQSGSLPLKKGKITINPTQGVLVDNWPIWILNVEIISNIYENPELLEVKP